MTWTHTIAGADRTILLGFLLVSHASAIKMSVFLITPECDDGKKEKNCFVIGYIRLCATMSKCWGDSAQAICWCSLLRSQQSWKPCGGKRPECANVRKRVCVGDGAREIQTAVVARWGRTQRETLADKMKWWEMMRRRAQWRERRREGSLRNMLKKKNVKEALGGEQRGDDDQWEAVGWRVKRAERTTATGWATDRCDGGGSDEEWQRRRRPRRGEEAIGRVTERLRLARKWCDWAGKAEGEDGQRPCGSDIRWIWSWVTGAWQTFFNTSSTVFMPKSSSKTNVLSCQNHVFLYLGFRKIHFFAYLNQTIFCGHNFVVFSCSVQLTQLYLSLKDNWVSQSTSVIKTNKQDKHQHVTGDRGARGHGSTDAQVPKQGPHAESESKL